MDIKIALLVQKLRQFCWNRWSLPVGGVVSGRVCACSLCSRLVFKVVVSEVHETTFCDCFGHHLLLGWAGIGYIYINLYIHILFFLNASPSNYFQYRNYSSSVTVTASRSSKACNYKVHVTGKGTKLKLIYTNRVHVNLLLFVWNWRLSKNSINSQYVGTPLHS